jgi:hypothetical protein
MTLRNTLQMGPIGLTLALGALFFTACDYEATEQLTERALENGGNSIFELDANTQNGPELGTDWDQVLYNDVTDFTANVRLSDLAPATVFSGGGSKDTSDLTQWRYKQTGSVPDKDDITNAYAAAYQPAGGDMIIYFGADRFSNSGDALLGFWFFKSNVQLLNNGRFAGEHQVGDVLILASFSNGGSTASIQALEWVGSGGNVNGGTLKLLLDQNFDCSAADDSTACATTNTAVAPTPAWSYITKGTNTSGPFPPFTFFEGGVNMTKLFASEGAVPCFASFLAETRSSTSVSATLKDFVVGSFPVCSIEVTAECPSATLSDDQSEFIYTYNWTVTNSGAGTIHDVAVSAAGQQFVIPELAPGAKATDGSAFTSQQNPASVSASVMAATSKGGALDLSDSHGPVQCPAVDRDPSIQLSNSCSASLESLGGKSVVAINYMREVCNIPPEGDPGIDLYDVAVTDTTTNEVIAVVDHLKVGQCQQLVSPTYYPSAFDLNSGFTNTIEVTGAAALGFGPVEDAATTPACKLCP